jgi:hypothetical protein
MRLIAMIARNERLTTALAQLSKMAFDTAIGSPRREVNPALLCGFENLRFQPSLNFVAGYALLNQRLRRDGFGAWAWFYAGY